MILDILNLIGVLLASAVSAFALKETKKLQTMSQQVSIMTHKRAARMDEMRKYSAEIISSSKLLLFECAEDCVKLKNKLVSSVASFAALLQYIYFYDKDLIDRAHELEDILVYSPHTAEDKEAVLAKINEFWKKCDLYVGVEHERLKNEAMGSFNESGQTSAEAKTFEELYVQLENAGRGNGT